MFFFFSFFFKKSKLFCYCPSAYPVCCPIFITTWTKHLTATLFGKPCTVLTWCGIPTMEQGYFDQRGYIDWSWFLWKLFLSVHDNYVQLLNFQFWSNVDTLIFRITTNLKLSLHLQSNKTLLKHWRSAKHIINLLPDSSNVSFNSI